jgi:signal peptide peptidase SppA
MRSATIIDSAYGDIWAIIPTAMHNAITFYDAHTLQTTVDAKLDHVAASQFRTGGSLPKIEGNIGVLPLTGIITQRSGNGLMEMLFGGTKVDAFTAQFKQMINTPSVGAIVLDIDSPGGSVFGVNELAATIREARGTKPIIGVANSMAGSAAYLIGSAVDTLVVTPGGQVGSIGVWNSHTDFSDAETQAGVKTTMISAGKFKTEGNPYEPLTDAGRENMQEQVDAYYEQFISAVAKGRGKPAATVRSQFGQGRMVMAQDALEAGMVDRVASFDQVMSELTRSNSKQKNRNRAALL